MSSAERGTRPLYGYDRQRWLINPKTGEKIPWVGNYSIGYKKGDEVSQDEDLPELKEPDDPTAARGF